MDTFVAVRPYMSDLLESHVRRRHQPRAGAIQGNSLVRIVDELANS